MIYFPTTKRFDKNIILTLEMVREDLINLIDQWKEKSWIISEWKKDGLI